MEAHRKSRRNRKAKSQSMPEGFPLTWRNLAWRRSSECGQEHYPESKAWQVEALRELLVLIRDALDLPDEIAAKIDAALRSEVGRLEFFEYQGPI